MKKVYKQPETDVLGYVHASATLMGSLGSDLKHPENSGLPEYGGSGNAPGRVF